MIDRGLSDKLNLVYDLNRHRVCRMGCVEQMMIFNRGSSNQWRTQKRLVSSIITQNNFTLRVLETVIAK